MSAYGKTLRPGYSICKREVGGGEGVGGKEEGGGVWEGEEETMGEGEEEG